MGPKHLQQRTHKHSQPPANRTASRSTIRSTNTAAALLSFHPGDVKPAASMRTIGGTEGPAPKEPLPQRPHIFQQYPQHLYRANRNVATPWDTKPSFDSAEHPLEIPPLGSGLAGCGESVDGSGGTASGGDSLSSTPESSWDAELAGDCGTLPMGDVRVEVSRKVSVGSRAAASTYHSQQYFRASLSIAAVMSRTSMKHLCVFLYIFFQQTLR